MSVFYQIGNIIQNAIGVFLLYFYTKFFGFVCAKINAPEVLARGANDMCYALVVSANIDVVSRIYAEGLSITSS